MRTLARSLSLLAATAAPALAQEAEHAETFGLMNPRAGLMIWTLIIFFLLFWILKRFAFPQIIGAVEARERALTEAIENAKRDREAAAALLAEHRAQIEGARGEAQKLIADARAAGERVRAEIVEQAQQQQADILARARAEIEAEKTRAILELRREAVDLAIAGASKVVERNLDDQTNRRLVEGFLASVAASPASR
jgi:F-type H+-transporting ATPase subunit b